MLTYNPTLQSWKRKHYSTILHNVFGYTWFECLNLVSYWLVDSSEKFSETHSLAQNQKNQNVEQFPK
jgi:hypothetical protein